MSAWLTIWPEMRRPYYEYLCDYHMQLAMQQESLACRQRMAEMESAYLRESRYRNELLCSPLNRMLSRPRK